MPRLAALHFTPELGASEANRERLLALCEEAADTDLLVLPELATTGFCLCEEVARELAEPVDGPTVQALAKLARAERRVIAFGLCLRDAEGLLRNAQVVLGRAGEVLSVYAKCHLWGTDRLWAVAGERAGAVVSTPVGLLGQVICADLGHADTVIALGDLRPDVVAFSTNWVGEGEVFPYSWQTALVTLAPATLVVANRGGEELAPNGAQVEFDAPSAILSLAAGGVIGARTSESYVLRASTDAPT